MPRFSVDTKVGIYISEKVLRVYRKLVMGVVRNVVTKAITTNIVNTL